MPNIGPLEIFFVLVIALLIFGPERLPEMARKVGRATNELRRMAAEVRSEFDVGLDDETPARSPESRSTTAVDDERESDLDFGDEEDAGWDQEAVEDEGAAWAGSEHVEEPPIAEGLEEAPEAEPATDVGVDEGAGAGAEKAAEGTSEEESPRDTGARGSPTSSGGS